MTPRDNVLALQRNNNRAGETECKWPQSDSMSCRSLQCTRREFLSCFLQCLTNVCHWRSGKELPQGTERRGIQLMEGLEPEPCVGMFCRTILQVSLPPSLGFLLGLLMKDHQSWFIDSFSSLIGVGGGATGPPSEDSASPSKQWNMILA